MGSRGAAGLGIVQRAFCNSSTAPNSGAHSNVEWSSEAGWVGEIKKKHVSEVTFKGCRIQASKEEPQYMIKSDKTDHLAMHKGSALQKVATSKI